MRGAKLEVFMSDRDQEMWSMAYALARSGDYPTSFHVETALKDMGFSNADLIAGDAWARQRITKICLEARKDKPSLGA